ncbi:MAG: hypothetical protein AAB652_02495 [Patescibacteria group bacterium]
MKTEDVTGWVGSICILLGYFLVSFQILSSEGILYQGINLAGAALFAHHAMKKKAWPVLFVQIVWGVIAAIVIARWIF